MLLTQNDVGQGFNRQVIPFFLGPGPTARNYMDQAVFEAGDLASDESCILSEVHLFGDAGVARDALQAALNNFSDIASKDPNDTEITTSSGLSDGAFVVHFRHQRADNCPSTGLDPQNSYLEGFYRSNILANVTIWTHSDLGSDRVTSLADTLAGHISSVLGQPAPSSTALPTPTPDSNHAPFVAAESPQSNLGSIVGPHPAR